MSFSIQETHSTAFLPFPGTRDFLLSEMKERFSIDTSAFVSHGELLFFEGLDTGVKNYDYKKGDSRLPYFASAVLFNVKKITFDSISDAASALRSLARSWSGCGTEFFRRSTLIQEKLPYVNLKPKSFPPKFPSSVTGIYLLIDEHTMLASENTTCVFPLGQLVFEEDHENPPSRAYLKIQEALTYAKLFFDAELPSENSFCFEAGACPGGWTWVLASLGSRVLAVDRSELAPSLMKNPLIQFKAHDAFTIPCEEIGNCDWVLSDVICYPERLLEWIQKWLSSGLVKNMICTIKMQGEIDWPLIKKFEEIPGSRIVHLNYNKHELTWIHV